MANVKVGTVTHYYDKIGVGIVKLAAPLRVGDTIKVVRKDGEFTQQVSSIEIKHQSVASGKKGDEIGIKMDQVVKEKDEVFKA